MSDAPVTSLSCSQCGGVLHPDEGQIFLTCPHCGSTVYLDGTVVFTGTWPPRWTTPMQMAPSTAGCRGPDDQRPRQEIQVIDQSFQYFPIWYFMIRQGEHESIDLERARQSRSPKSPISIYPQAIYGLTIPESTHSRLLHPCLSRQPRIGCFARIQALRSNRAPWYTCQSTFIVTNTAIKPTPPWSKQNRHGFCQPVPAKVEAPYLAVGGDYRHSLPMPGRPGLERAASRRSGFEFWRGLAAGGDCGSISVFHGRYGGVPSMSDPSALKGLGCPRCGGMVPARKGRRLSSAHSVKCAPWSAVRMESGYNVPLRIDQNQAETAFKKFISG